jgi:hypothetical protein
MRFDPKKREYVDDNGRVLSPATVRAEVSDYVAQEKKRVESEAKKFVAGTITATSFFMFMKLRIEAWHRVAGAIAYGGKAQIDTERDARIAAKIKSELEYLAGFKRDVLAALARIREAKKDEDSIDWIIHRALMYADSAYATYENNVMAREFDAGVKMGRRVCPEDDASCEECVAAADTYFSLLEDLPEIGTLQCLNNCRCYVVYAEAPVPRAEIVVDRTHFADAVQ